MKMARNNLQAAHERKFFTGELANKIRRGKIMNNKRSGASLINVLIFMFAAMMITAQVFFFFENESISLKEDREILQVRMRLENLVETAKSYLETNNTSALVSNISADYMTFKDNISTTSGGTKVPSSLFKQDYWDNQYHVKIHTLNYPLKARDFDASDWENIEAHERIFSPMGPGYYLIRAYTALSSGSSLMHQVLVYKDSSTSPAKIRTRSYEEIWYQQ